ncbi:MAG TPA: KamA family protein [Prolixibacteraceae bacterium]|nr:KamA family protein [Prolixibacteraceae bacterium]
MNSLSYLDQIAISVRAHKLLKELLKENPRLEEIMRSSRNETEALHGLRDWVEVELKRNAAAWQFYLRKKQDQETFQQLKWKDFAAIRLLDYIDHAGEKYVDQNIGGEIAITNPIKMIWLAVNFGTGGAKPGFFKDMLQLFRQFTNRTRRNEPNAQKIAEWMSRFPSGLDPRIVRLREENRDRILNVFLDKMETGEISDPRYQFPDEMSHEERFNQMLEWWKTSHFHLRMAIRSPHLLNEMLGNSLDPDTMKVLQAAEKAGIPFFVNPYYLSLLHVRVPYFAVGADLGIRHYILYSQQLVDEFGKIQAWEKEDKVVPGKPNAAGWHLPPYNNIHRRYPEVAILIPDTTGRACGGLCTSCQRMYDFQRGNLNFNLDKLEPKVTWKDKLRELMDYFENDSQLRDILITGGDALMSSDNQLQSILDEVYNMAIRKREANRERPTGEKYAEIQRVRLGTRLPVYLPQRVTPELIAVLKGFREKASKVGIRQFVIQTHFQSPMEVTPEAARTIKMFLSAGWAVVNQLVFTVASSRRGHSSKLRKVLNDIGVLTYYTFSVKGYMENSFNFAPNSRAVQEQFEEKLLGRIPEVLYDEIKDLTEHPDQIVDKINTLRNYFELPFLATDRNVLNLPGVGKSLTFRVIGITRYGRRILEFDHDHTRRHSPAVKEMEKVIIIESKSIIEYLEQLQEMGEDINEYEGIYGYSIGQTEPRMAMYSYPDYDYTVTREFTNLDMKTEVDPGVSKQ